MNCGRNPCDGRNCCRNEQQVDEEFRRQWERMQANRCQCVNQSQEDMRRLFVESEMLLDRFSDCVNRMRDDFTQRSEPIKVKAEVVREKPLALPEE